MLRLFVRGARAGGPCLRITGPELRHLRACRLGPGDHLLVFDERGDEHEVRLQQIGARAADGMILASRRPARDSALDLVLAPALLRGAKMDFVIEKAVELGVRRIAPFSCRRVVGLGVRTDRWQRIATAAAEQSGRVELATVDPPRALAELVGLPWPGLRLMAWEGEAERPLASLPRDAKAVVIVVGPEGGLAEDEVAVARAHGFASVTLAPRILRAETAAIVAAALCQHRWGDLSSAGGVS